MLTDIFAERYSKRVIWNQFTESEAKLLMQCFRLIAEDVIPYWVNGKENESSKAKWHSVHDRLCRELGLSELGPLYYSYEITHLGTPVASRGAWTMDVVCKNFVTGPYTPSVTADRFVKERLSLVELAFRLKEQEIAQSDANLPARIAAAELEQALRAGPRLQVPGNRADALEEWNRTMNDTFRTHVEELNERLRRAGVPLNYHNGFIQISRDELVQAHIEMPFWRSVSDPLWKNVDIDMKEALDRRDAKERDPALYSAKALESAIKIISDKKGWTHGGEKGAHAYIDNLSSAKSGHFLADWERESLKAFFTAVRNPLGHGPGGKKMPELTPAQTEWAIETCMSWIKTLIARLTEPLSF